MSADEWVLWLQRLIDRAIRRLRLGRAPEHDRRRRLLIVQIDGLSRSVLEQALRDRRMPFLAHLMAQHGYRLQPMSVGMPTSTPAFQMAAMYGVRPDIPGFHYHDKRQGTDIYFPRAGDAARVEREHTQGRRGILDGGTAYGCVFTGGAQSSLFNFATFKRPTGRGLLRAISAFAVLAWVLAKGLVVTLVALVRTLLRVVADPVHEPRRGWKWLAIKVGISVWLRQLFTLAVARDLYAGVPAIYVNYLDYDVFAHAYGPRHRWALPALRGLDRSIRQLWRVTRRVPGYRYDLYVLSDHGQALCTPFPNLSGGKPLERSLFEEVFQPAAASEVSPLAPRGRRLARGIKAFRSHRAPGVFQRFVNYLERDFPRLLGETPEACERGAIRVIAAGPNAFVYFLDDARPLTIEWIDARFPGLADDLGRRRGIGFILARSAGGPICLWRGKRFGLADGAAGPFAERRDWPLVAEGLRDLMAMPSAGDLVLYGHDSPDGNVSFIPELGAHAGPSADELYTFIVTPPGAQLPTSLTHPVQLYAPFVSYQDT